MEVVKKPQKPIVLKVFANGHAVVCQCGDCKHEKTVSMKKLPKYCENCGAAYDWEDFE